MIPIPFLRRHPWFILVVVVPTLLATIYYFVIASDIYLSESRFVIRSPGQKPPQTSTLANLIQTTGLSAGQEETNEILEYVRSRNAVADLDRSIALRQRFGSHQADFIARYPAPWQPDRFETLFKYYGSMVDARVDVDTGIAVLDVKAFRPEDAYAINNGLLDLSERLVNELNTRAQSKVISEGEQRVTAAEGRVRRARLALARYRNANGLLDPEKQGAGVLQVSNQLVSEEAALQAQLDLMLNAAPANPSIPAIKSRIAAIDAQIAAQNGRAVGTSSGIASKLGTYENLTLEQDFAAQTLTAASAALEQARNDALRQQFYLERVVQPNTPDLARYPSRLKLILTVLASSLCLYFVGWMLVVGILEHSPED
jgi:capsular polysaccharide transport system permease protein